MRQFRRDSLDLLFIDNNCGLLLLLPAVGGPFSTSLVVHGEATPEQTHLHGLPERLNNGLLTEATYTSVPVAGSLFPARCWK